MSSLIGWTQTYNQTCSYIDPVGYICTKTAGTKIKKKNNKGHPSGGETCISWANYVNTNLIIKTSQE